MCYFRHPVPREGGTDGQHATKHDVELARTVGRYQLFRSLAPAIWIATSALPIVAAVPVARALSGKDTNVTLTVSISIAFTLIVGGTVLALLRKTAAQRAEIERLRRRIEELEKELET